MLKSQKLLILMIILILLLISCKTITIDIEKYEEIDFSKLKGKQIEDILKAYAQQINNISGAYDRLVIDIETANGYRIKVNHLDQSDD